MNTQSRPNASRSSDEGIFARNQAREMAKDADRWPNDKAAELQRIAASMFQRHECGGSHLLIMRENCQACCLVKGELSPSKRTATKKQPPNVAGWLRDYIQARRYVPVAWLLPELARAEIDNKAYYDAILRDIKTFDLVEPRS